MEGNNYSLNNLENYNNDCDYIVTDVNTKYLTIIFEYLKNITENIKIKDNFYFKFIVIRGIETISHTFSYLLHCTNNLNLTYYHSQKALYLYIEFITQIIEEKNSFLELSYTDATIYVYKKTIFELEPNYCKNNELICVINEFIHLTINIICFTIHTHELLNINKGLFDMLTKICNMDLNKKELYSIYVFIQTINPNTYLDTIKNFIQNIKR